MNAPACENSLCLSVGHHKAVGFSHTAGKTTELIRETDGFSAKMSKKQEQLGSSFDFAGEPVPAFAAVQMNFARPLSRVPARRQ